MKKSPVMNQAGAFILFILLLLAINFFKDKTAPPEKNNGALEIERAFANQQSDIQIFGNGNIVKILPDDTKGSRHQKFIVSISPQITVLIAHNIDLAPRIKDIATGENISFYGEYEWNHRGGVIHWTHRDPGKRHINGWLKFRGKIYQ